MRSWGRQAVRRGRAALLATVTRDDEHAHAVALAEWARLQTACDAASPLGLLFAIPNGGFRTARTAGRLYAEGLKRGVSDYCLPVARRGYGGVFLELKRPERAARLSPEQRAWLEAVATQAFYGAACWGAAAAEACLRWYVADEPLERIEGEYGARRVPGAPFDRWVPAAWGGDG